MKLNTFLDVLVILKSESYKAVGGIEVEWSKLITKMTPNWYMICNKYKCTDCSEETQLDSANKK